MKTGWLLFVLCGCVQAASRRKDLAEAQRLQAAGEFAKAAAAYQSILDRAKGLAPLEWNDLALALFYASRYREAETAYHHALEGLERMGAAGRGIAS
ncbi:MAG TPA: hypothetical protein VKV17_10505 [Bryobacteraceae bacterium]|nr:hypothetical protein [Bryobacteraceae bacterium]